MKNKYIYLFLVIVLMGFTLSGCGGSDDAEKLELLRDTLIREVVIRDNFFLQNKITVPVNTKIRFVVRNEGEFAHEFQIKTNPPESVELAPKSNSSLELEFKKKGELEFIDSINDNEHVNNMRGTLVVE